MKKLIYLITLFILLCISACRKDNDPGCREFFEQNNFLMKLSIDNQYHNFGTSRNSDSIIRYYNNLWDIYNEKHHCNIN